MVWEVSHGCQKLMNCSSQKVQWHAHGLILSCEVEHACRGHQLDMQGLFMVFHSCGHQL